MDQRAEISLRGLPVHLAADIMAQGCGHKSCIKVLAARPILGLNSSAVLMARIHKALTFGYLWFLMHFDAFLFVFGMNCEAEQTSAERHETSAPARLRSHQEPVHGQRGCRASGSSIRAGGRENAGATPLRDIVTAFIMQHGVDAPGLKAPVAVC